MVTGRGRFVGDLLDVDARHAVFVRSPFACVRLDLALALRLGPEWADVIAPDAGGAFDSKASVFPEDLLLVLATRRLGGAMCWQSTRMEDLASGTHGRARQLLGKLRLDGEGRMSALQAEARFALGHWRPYSAVVPMRNAARILPGPYRIECLHISAEARMSNAAAVGIYRGAGRPEAAMLMERWWMTQPGAVVSIRCARF